MSEYIIAIYKHTDGLLKKRMYLQLPAHIIDLCIFLFVDTVYNIITEEHNIVYIQILYWNVPVRDTSCRTLIAVCVCVCLCVCPPTYR